MTKDEAGRKPEQSAPEPVRESPPPAEQERPETAGGDDEECPVDLDAVRDRAS